MHWSLTSAGVNDQMHRNRVLVGLSAAGVVCVSALGVQAAAPETAVCAVEQAIACPTFEPCERSLPGAVNLPALMKIDRPAGVVLSRLDTGEERASEIGSEAGDDTMHVLQGVDQGHPWSLRVALETGRFTLTIAEPETGFVAFGICSTALAQ
jgi:hypothetical protein